jgi:hypothetical protein
MISSRPIPDDEELLVSVAIDYDEREGAVFCGGAENARRLLDIADELAWITPIVDASICGVLIPISIQSERSRNRSHAAS